MTTPTIAEARAALTQLEQERGVLLARRDLAALERSGAAMADLATIDAALLALRPGLRQARRGVILARLAVEEAAATDLTGAITARIAEEERQRAELATIPRSPVAQLRRRDWADSALALYVYGPDEGKVIAATAPSAADPTRITLFQGLTAINIRDRDRALANATAIRRELQVFDASDN